MMQHISTSLKARQIAQDRPLTLRRRREFLHAQKRGVKRSMAHFVLQAVQSPVGQTGSRMGYTASKKVGNAVARNRAKRRMRALARLYLPEIAMSGTDYVFIAKNTLPDATWDKLVRDFKKAIPAISRKLAYHISDKPAPVATE